MSIILSFIFHQSSAFVRHQLFTLFHLPLSTLFFSPSPISPRPLSIINTAAPEGKIAPGPPRPCPCPAKPIVLVPLLPTLHVPLFFCVPLLRHILLLVRVPLALALHVPLLLLIPIPLRVLLLPALHVPLLPSLLLLELNAPLLLTLLFQLHLPILLALRVLIQLGVIGDVTFLPATHCYSRYFRSRCSK